MDNAPISELAALCQEAAARRNVPDAAEFGPRALHEQWATDRESREDSLPLQAGHGPMAWLVLHSKWYSWLGIDGQIADQGHGEAAVATSEES